MKDLRIEKIKVKHEEDDFSEDCDKFPPKIGIRAEAEVSYDFGNGGRRSEYFTSCGIWGIDNTSSQEYLTMVEEEELKELKEHLEVFGIPTDNFETLIERI